MAINGKDRHKLVTCGVCGQQSLQTKWRAPRHAAFQDLDMRRHEPARSDWLKIVCHCPTCGLCYPDLSHGHPNWKPTLENAAYRETLTNQHRPARANWFMCMAHIKRELARIGPAGLCSLVGAWVCDDSNSLQPARECRAQAGDLMLLAQQRGWAGFGPGRTRVAIVDVFRRAGRMADAQYAIEGLSAGASACARSLLMFELWLICDRDDERHTLMEADLQLRHYPYPPPRSNPLNKLRG